MKPLLLILFALILGYIGYPLSLLIKGKPFTWLKEHTVKWFGGAQTIE